MTRIFIFIFLLLTVATASAQQSNAGNIVTSDIENFWRAYDKITSTKDSVLQYQYLNELYLDKATAGLNAMRQVRDYTPQDFIHAINSYPKFWSSIRKNTMRVADYSAQLEMGIGKLRMIYPGLRPAKIYFTIGALRSNGTTRDSLVLIGSELAMTDRNTFSDEFPEDQRTFRQTFFNSEPIDDLVLLNIHEYVHTQQKPMVHNILSEVIYEGVAEFVSVTAMGVPSAVPAIEYGKKNTDKVRARFEHEMFYSVNRYKWLWSNEPNTFGVWDMGYYVGYQMCEIFYNNAKDKKEAIRTLIELDYTDETAIENFVDGTGFLSAPLEELYQEFEKKRPTVTGIKQFRNGSNDVQSTTQEITFEFSEPLNGYNTGIDYGPSGEGAFPKIIDRSWSDDAKSFTVKVELNPNREYQFVLENNFRTSDWRPLKSYLVEFRTAE